MRVLLLNQFFWPDNAPTARLLGDVAESLVRKGHDVTVIAAATHYRSSPESHSVEGVNLIHVPTPGKKRIAQYAMYLIATVAKLLFVRRPDVVVTLTTPPLLSLVGTLLKGVRGCRHVIWEMDVYPDVAIAVGALRRNSTVGAVIRGVADWSRRQADAIVVLGDCMKRLIETHGIAPEKLHICENWEEAMNAVTPKAAPPFTVLYAGNLGRAHEIDTVCKSIERLGSESDIQFVFMGSGPKLSELRDFCQQRSAVNVTFRDHCDRVELADVLGTCDVGLVTMLPGCAGTVVPSKVYSLLSVGRPFLFIGPGDATPAHLIRRFGCGWHVEVGDEDGVVGLLRALSRDRARVHAAGALGRTAFLEHYERSIGVSRLCDVLGA